MDLRIESAAELDAALGDFVSGFRYVDRRNMKSVAAGFCRLFDLKEIPRNPFIILPEVLGIELRRNPGLSRGVPAQWGCASADGRYCVEYSEQRRHETLSISMWHEVGEILLRNPRCPTRSTPICDAECSLAQLFAVNVLMPEVAVRRLAEEYGHPDRLDKSRTLAARFFVSAQAMRIRLAELGLEHRRRGPSLA